MVITTSDNWALVTGASSGIGRHLCLHLARRGYNIIGVSNQPDRLPLIEKEVLRIADVKVLSKSMDLAETHAPQELYNWCKSKGITVEVLVNNAGILIANTMLKTDVERVSTLSRLHVHTTTMLCRLFAQDMVERQCGYILNMSSISAVLPYPIISLYGPSKAYLRAFSKAIRTELRPENVKVSCILPGATDTPLNDITEKQKRLFFRLGLMMSADNVADKAIDGLFSGKAEIIPGLINKLIVWLMPLLPQFIIIWAFGYYRKKMNADNTD